MIVIYEAVGSSFAASTFLEELKCISSSNESKNLSFTLLTGNRDPLFINIGNASSAFCSGRTASNETCSVLISSDLSRAPISRRHSFSVNGYGRKPITFA